MIGDNFGIKIETIGQTIDIYFRPMFDAFHIGYKGTGYGGQGRVDLLMGEIWRESIDEKNFIERLIDTMNHEIFEALDVPHEWIVELGLACQFDISLPPLPPGFDKIDREALLKGVSYDG